MKIQNPRGLCPYPCPEKRSWSWSWSWSSNLKPTFHLWEQLLNEFWISKFVLATTFVEKMLATLCFQFSFFDKWNPWKVYVLNLYYWKYTYGNVCPFFFMSYYSLVVCKRDFARSRSAKCWTAWTEETWQYIQTKVAHHVRIYMSCIYSKT